ncbi:hypothetical protein D3C77_443760 [compost metagenome]
MQVTAQAQRHFLEQQVAHVMTESVVDRLEAVQVDEHQRETTTLLAHFADGLVNAIGQQCAVGQPGQGVVQGQLGQFLVGPGQRARQFRGARFKAGIEYRGQQCHRQHGQGGDQHQVIQTVATQATTQGAAEAAFRKVGRSHGGVVHADNRNAHHHGSGAANLTDIESLLTKAEGNPQGGRRGAYGNHQ